MDKGLKNIEAEYAWTKAWSDLLNIEKSDLEFEPEEFHELFDRLCVLLRRRYLTLRTVRRKGHMGDQLVRHYYDSRDRKVRKYIEIKTDGGQLYRKTAGDCLKLHMMKDVAATVRGYLEELYTRKMEDSQAVRDLRDTSDFLSNWTIPGEEIMKNATGREQAVGAGIPCEAQPSEVFTDTDEEYDDD